MELIKYLVDRYEFDWSAKVNQYMEDGWYDVEDLRLCVMKGSIHKTERDERADSAGNKKYVIIGHDTKGYEFYTVGKIKRTAEGKTYFFITAHQSEGHDDV